MVTFKIADCRPLEPPRGTTGHNRELMAGPGVQQYEHANLSLRCGVAPSARRTLIYFTDISYAGRRAAADLGHEEIPKQSRIKAYSKAMSRRWS
jgi:hypothetical protein